MSAPTLSPRLTAAVRDRTSGATGVARQVIDGLLELAGDRHLLHRTADSLPGLFPGYASMWHIVRAARGEDPESALHALRDGLDHDVARSVQLATKLLQERGGIVRTAPSSALVKAVTSALPAGTVDPDAGDPGTIVTEATGIAGADAISPTTVLNIRGTLDLARSIPTIVVTTSLKLVPETVFANLGSPLFERIPLDLFEAIVLDGELLTPAEAGHRALLAG